MKSQTRMAARFAAGLCTAAAALAALAAPALAQAQQAGATDPRVGLRGGLTDAAVAARHIEHLSNHPRPDGLQDLSAPGDLNFANSDMAFQGNYVFVGNFAGFQIFDASNPASPVLRTTVVCPGGQGDISVHANLLFMSVEQPRGRVDCGPQGVDAPASPERFRGVRIFDIADVDNPRQVAAVQSCRGSHTHTLVADPADDAHIYFYISGAAGVRPDEELPGCSRLGPEEDPATALFRIEVVRVPLASPQDARIVNAPRIFAEGGEIAGLWEGGDHGPGTQRTAQTNHCHDITVYPAVGLAAGACAGNGILLDIRDPANPVRIAEVVDPNFAYWHSATFNNAGNTVIFTDEWGGGTQPRCRAEDLSEWGANAIYEIVDGRFEQRSYYKLPAAQAPTENCVAHNGSLVPVPGRDIKVQAWYQGGISVFDFTDAANPVEIAYFDRGPISEDELVVGGFWSAYWHSGLVYGSEMARGLDIFRLTPSEHLTQNEIDAANLVHFHTYNPQHQQRFEWPAHASVPRAYLDQLERGSGMPADAIARVRAELDRAWDMAAGAERNAALTRLGGAVESMTGVTDATRVRSLAGAIRALGEAR